MRSMPSIAAVYSRYRIQQFGKVAGLSVRAGATVAIDVLSQQVDLAHAVFGQVRDFMQHVGQWPADFFAAGIGHHAEGAVLAAAFHH